MANWSAQRLAFLGCGLVVTAAGIALVGPPYEEGVPWDSIVFVVAFCMFPYVVHLLLDRGAVRVVSGVIMVASSIVSFLAVERSDDGQAGLAVFAGAAINMIVVTVALAIRAGGDRPVGYWGQRAAYIAADRRFGICDH